MPRNTTRFGFQVVELGDDPFINGRKFFESDKDLLDLLLWLALSGHTHDGAAGSNDAPDSPALLSLETTGGQIAAGATIWYTWTLVNDATLVESGPAPAAFITTPARVASPGAPTLAWAQAGGVVLPGQYNYVLSAYTDYITNETEAGGAQGVIVGPGTTTNRVIIQLPDLPGGATGFNIYRREPGGRNYLYLDSVDMTVATPPDEYVDDGTVTEDCDKIAPNRNTTNATNAITIELPADMPVLPAGYHWKLYRTVNAGDWSASLLQDVVEQTFEGSGIIRLDWLDTGQQTTSGEPPAGTFDFSNPGKIDLTDGANVQGSLPSGMVAGFPHVETFYFPGDVDVTAGTTQWRCPYPNAVVLAVGGHLDLDSVASSTDVQIEAHRHRAGVATDIYGGPYPEIPVGENMGDFLAPSVIANATLQRDDTLTVSCVQDGGGATPTAEGLTVTVYILAYGFDATTSYVAGQAAPLGLF